MPLAGAVLICAVRRTTARRPCGKARWSRRSSRWPWRPCCCATTTPGDEPYAAVELALAGRLVGHRHPASAVGLDGLSLWLFGLSALLLVTSRAGELGGDRRPAGGVLCAAAAVGQRHAGRVRGPRHHPVLHLLRVHADPAVLPDRHLGAAKSAATRPSSSSSITLAGSLLTFLGLLAIVLWDYNHVGHGRDDVFDSRADAPAWPSIRSPRRISCGSSWRCSPALPSRCRCFRCTPGCRWRTRRRRRPAA